jgi:hypothetical protein
MKDATLVMCLFAGAVLSACLDTGETPPVQVNQVEVSPATATLATGASQPFTCTVTGSGCTWSVQEGSSGGSVSSGGVYTAPSTPGTYHVIAASRADPSKAAVATITVTAPSDSVSVSINPATAALAAGASQPFTCMVTGSADSACTWFVKEGSSGGSVTSGGVYTAPAVSGTYHVVATSRADPLRTAVATITVTGSPGSVAVSINPATAAIAVGASQPFTCTVTGSADSACSWSVKEGSSGGSVTSDGVYTAPAVAGTYHVIATSSADPSKAASATVTVREDSPGITGPCDIYQAGNTPCVAAHSTVRALYGSYSGNLYQVRRASDKTTKDIAVLGPGGYANSATQDAFCSGTTCTISVIYDQSPQGNHLTVSPAGGWLKYGGTEAKATDAKVKVNGHTVYGVYTTGSFDEKIGGVGYRNNKTKGVATGDQPEAMYMVASGKHYNQWCCFDYGNAETNNLDNGPATMEAVYFGNSTQWGKGSGDGPWVMADLEEGVFAGQSFEAPASNTPLIADYVTAMLKGKPGTFALKGGDAQSGGLKTMYDGKTPNRYSPMKKEGAIILGTGGDNSHTGEGTFFEGCMTFGYPSDATDDAVQANIVAAGYGR